MGPPEAELQRLAEVLGEATASAAVVAMEAPSVEVKEKSSVPEPGRG